MIGLDDIYTRLETALEAGSIAWWEMELPSGVVFFSDNKARMLGMKPSDFTHYSHFMDLVHIDDQEQAMEAMRLHVAGAAESYETKYRIAHKDGHYITFYDRGKIVFRDNDVTKIAGIVVDVTNKKDFI